MSEERCSIYAEHLATQYAQTRSALGNAAHSPQQRVGQQRHSLQLTHTHTHTHTHARTHTQLHDTLFSRIRQTRGV